MNAKVVVITGASSGIGAALAEHLARRGDASLSLVARRQDALAAVAARCDGGSAVPIVADVTSRADIDRVVDQTIGRFGGIDVWINNAGRGITRMPTQLTDEDIDEMMRVNVKSVVYGMQAVLPHFKERGRGHIINISSMLGRVPFATFRSAYCAAKHFMNAITATFRAEVQQTHPDIQISIVSPGVVHTDFGLNAVHGGIDSRQIEGQSAEDVARVIAGVIDSRLPDVYTRPGARQQIVKYYETLSVDAPG